MKIVPNDTRRVKHSSIRSHSRHFPVTLLELVQQDVALTERKGEWWGLCPFHTEKTPSFSVNQEKGVYSCFSCLAAGDAIQYLRDKRGYSFREAARMVGKETSPTFQRQHHDQQIDREIELRRYYVWWHARLEDWNELLDEIFYAEVAYRALNRVPNLYTEEEHQYWSKRLGDLYFRQSVSQQLMDLTAAERFAAWQEEAGKS